ncbi:hypothetical protein FRC06_003698, partial [Ceratobasidium sp. 370]
MAPSGLEPIELSSTSEGGLIDPNQSSIWHSSQPNQFGLIRKYLVVRGHVPTVPDLNLPAAYFTRLLAKYIGNTSPDRSRALLDIIYPFPNTSTFRLAHWFITGSSTKSQDERKRLVSEVILAPGFSPEHF